MKKTPSFKIVTQILNFLLSVFFIMLLWITLFRPDLVEEWINWIGEIVHFIGNWNYLVILSSSLIESFPVIGVLVPWQQIMLLSGGFFGKDHIIWVFFLSSFGAIIGNAIGFFLGKWYGKSFFLHYWNTFGIGKTERDILERQIAKNWPLFIIFGKFHNFTRAFVPFIAGSSWMQSKKFWIYNIIGSVFWACSMMILGIFFTTYLKWVLSSISYIFLGIILSVAVYISIWKRKEFKKYLADKMHELDNLS